jgi:hypothetical protein
VHSSQKVKESRSTKPSDDLNPRVAAGKAAAASTSKLRKNLDKSAIDRIFILVGE